MLIFLIILHVVICVALVLAILVQTGKGGLDSNFGGIATSAFGSQGANEFIKFWTKILFAAFVISCLLLATQVKKSPSGRVRSRLSEEAQREMQSIPMEENFFDDNSEVELQIIDSENATEE